MKNKNIGYLILGISLLVLFSLIFYNIQINRLIDELMASSGGVCLVDGKCVHERTLLPLYIGSISFVVLLGLGLYLIFRKERIITKVKTIKQQIEPKKVTKENYQKFMKDLTKDERLVLERIIESQGTIFQSDLVDKTGLNKVKITRVLDKLEGMGIVERRRRGMTNVILLRN